MFIMKSKIQFYSFIFFVAFFSCTENNEDFKEWVAAGNTPDPAD